jgi:hypothetical protein
MNSQYRTINNLAKLAAHYTADLAVPFEDNIEQNEAAETPLLILSDVCRAMGLDYNQTWRVLGERGMEFVEYLENAAAISIEADRQAILFGRTVTVGKNGISIKD